MLTYTSNLRMYNLVIQNHGCNFTNQLKVGGISDSDTLYKSLHDVDLEKCCVEQNILNQLI